MRILKQLDDPKERLQLLRRLDCLQCDARPEWGRMNAVQMLEHLARAFELALGERQAAARPSVLRGPLGRFGALYFPVRWKRGYPTLPEMDVLRGSASTADFDQIKARVSTLIRQFGEATPQQLAEQHPIFGRMSRRDWMLWGYRHTDHHLRQFGCPATSSGAGNARAS